MPGEIIVGRAGDYARTKRGKEATNKTWFISIGDSC
jgi:hypothetical protein